MDDTEYCIFELKISYSEKEKELQKNHITSKTLSNFRRQSGLDASQAELHHTREWKGET